MDGEQKLMMIVYCLLAVCITVLYSFLFLSLWQYRTYVGVTLLAVIVLLVVVPVWVHMRGKLNEQELRHRRYRFQEEIPFDQTGEPAYLPKDAQANPHRYYQHSSMQHPYNQGYGQE